MSRLAFRGWLVAALALIVITDAALLAAAAWNRRGEPTAKLALTERELALPQARQDEGTDLELSLLLTHQPPDALQRVARWKRYELPEVSYAWLDRDKLRELGFDVDLDPADPEAVDHYKYAVPRRAYVVLEYDGPAWEAWIEGREEELRELAGEVAGGSAAPGALADAEALLALDRTMRSRLMPVDAGVDADALRRRWADRGRYAIVPASFRPTVLRRPSEAPSLVAEPMFLAVGRVHVTREHRRLLEDLLPTGSWSEVEERARRLAAGGWPEPAPPRYRAELAVGRHHESWLVDLAVPARTD